MALEKKALTCCFPVHACCNLATHLPSSIPMKGSLLLSATSIAKLIEGCALFSVARKLVAVGMSCMHHGWGVIHVSSVEIGRLLIFPFQSFSSMEHMNVFAKSGPRDDPIAMQTAIHQWLYVGWLKAVSVSRRTTSQEHNNDYYYMYPWQTRLVATPIVLYVSREDHRGVPIWAFLADWISDVFRTNF